ncbi:hypothetical protein F4778DRAFT_713782 [Xylariomycetidae sp. FL2044]|nr:hypothetical protein F4778DRAFT_713782 [Xylariomycetidae sp. FL2044]
MKARLCVLSCLSASSVCLSVCWMPSNLLGKIQRRFRAKKGRVVLELTAPTYPLTNEHDSLTGILPTTTTTHDDDDDARARSARPPFFGSWGARCPCMDGCICHAMHYLLRRQPAAPVHTPCDRPMYSNRK